MENINHPADILHLVSRPIVQAASATASDLHSQVESWLGVKMTPIYYQDSLSNFVLNSGLLLWINVICGLIVGIVLPLWQVMNMITVACVSVFLVTLQNGRPRLHDISHRSSAFLPCCANATSRSNPCMCSHIRSFYLNSICM